jgi:hypothetical protein
MPPPCYDLRTRRPLYLQQTQKLCLEIRATNIAWDGSYVVFNQKHSASAKHSRMRRGPKSDLIAATADPAVRELIEGLRALGINDNDEQIKTAVAECYSERLDAVPPGTVLKTVFRHLRRSCAV